MTHSQLSENLKKLRVKKGYSQRQLAEILNVAQNTVSNWEKGTREPDLPTISKLADLFEVTTDYLLGRSIFSIVERRLIELGLTIEEVEKMMEWPQGMLESLDTFPPYPGDYEKGGMIDKLAKILRMDSEVLVSAYARQEPPAYDGPVSSVEEEFRNIDFSDVLDEQKLKKEVRMLENMDKLLKPKGASVIDVVEKDRDIETIAAHHEGEDWTEEELEEIEEFKQYVKMRRLLRQDKEE